MARFPSREAEVAVLAAEIINGLTENSDDFPAPPVGTAELQASLDAFRTTHDAAVSAQAAAAEAFDVKDEALALLSDQMRHAISHPIKHLRMKAVELVVKRVAQVAPGFGSGHPGAARLVLILGSVQARGQTIPQFSHLSGRHDVVGQYPRPTAGCAKLECGARVGAQKGSIAGFSVIDQQG